MMNSIEMLESTKKIYEHLQDDISRRIYSNRVLYNLTSDDYFLRNVFKEWNWESQLLSDLKKYNSSICIYGAGDFGNRLIRFYPEISWECYVDEKADEIKELNNLKVISIEDYVKKGLPIIISVKKEPNLIKKTLVDYGVPENKILCLHNYLNEMNNIYFDLLEPHTYEVFADVGAYDGKSTYDFFEWCGMSGNSKAFVFEPNEDMKNAIVRTIQKGKDYKIVQAGAWDRNTRLGFVKSNKADSSHVVEDEETIENGIDVVSLDTYFESEAVLPTYIKMDIEGAEFNALIGAKKIISEHKPRLAISIYHKQEDLWVLPNLLLDFCPDYKFYVRHYTMAHADTVLYAV